MTALDRPVLADAHMVSMSLQSRSISSLIGGCSHHSSVWNCSVTIYLTSELTLRLMGHIHSVEEVVSTFHQSVAGSCDESANGADGVLNSQT